MNQTRQVSCARRKFRNARLDGFRVVISVSLLAGCFAADSETRAASTVESSPLPAASTATGQSADSVTLTDIVVTAEKRVSTLQDTPVAITAISEDALQQRNVLDVQDLNDLVPGVQFYPIGNVVQTAVRGLGSTFFDPRGDSAVSTSIDGLYFARPVPSGGLFYDLARIEVLKGPQGTLYGRNAGVGAVNLVTNLPTDRLEGSASVTFGNYSTRNTTDVLNLPISDTLKVRGAFQSVNHDGYLGDYYNDAKTDSGRISVLWEPFLDLTVLGEANYSHQGGNGNIPASYPCPGAQPYSLYIPLTCGANGAPGNAYMPKTGAISNDTGDYQMHVDYDFGWARLTSISGLVQSFSRSLDHPNGLTFAVSGRSHTLDYSEEVRLAGTDTARHAAGLEWVIGVYGEYGKGTAFSQSQGPAIYQDINQHSAAIFGQATYGLTDTTRLTAGGRYSADRKALSDNLGDQLAQSSDIFTYKAGVEHDLTRKNMLYADIATGYVAGGASGGDSGLPSPPQFAQPIFQPERNTAYEIGSKNRFFDDRVQVNGDAYDYHFKNYQIFQPSLLNNSPNLEGNIQNIGDVTTYGAELDVVVAVTQLDQFTASVDYARGTYKSLSFASFGGFPPFFEPVHVSAPAGSPIVNLPKWEGILGFAHTFPLPNGANLVAEADANISDHYGLVPGSTSPIDVQRSYAKGDVSVTFNSPEKKWFVEGYVKNVSNVAVVNYGEAIGQYLYSILPPRTYGVTLEGRFSSKL